MFGTCMLWGGPEPRIPSGLAGESRIPRAHKASNLNQSYP